MTDPEFPDRTYVEPLIPEIAERLIPKERPAALLPQPARQTALNLAVALLRHAGVPRVEGARVRGRALELEPGDDHDRPRVRRPHLRRAAHSRDRRAHHPEEIEEH